jgi:AbrB family looped-hinge helix DNA binding protein
MDFETVRIGRRGTVVLPAALRKEYKLEEGSLLIAEPLPEGILLRPALALSVERYTLERKAQFLLNNSVNTEDYAWAVEEVKKLGLDPENIPHERPENI